MDKMKVIDLKRLRGIILVSLDESTTTKQMLLTGTVRNAFKGTHTSTDIYREIDYLSDKGYIEKINPDENEQDNILIRITAKGRDLLEETIMEDPGVMFG